LSDVIRVRLGDYIPLIAVVSNGDQDKVIKVDLYNQDTGALLTIAPITLTAIAPGYYQDNSYVMPPVKRVLALMNVFESDGTTPSNDTEQVGTALFEINDDSTAYAGFVWRRLRDVLSRQATQTSFSSLTLSSHLT
jgi:hypothetical protein